MDEVFLQTSEAARILRKSVESVREYERKGLLLAIKTPRGVRLFRESDVLELRETLKSKKRG